MLAGLLEKCTVVLEGESRGVDEDGDGEGEVGEGGGEGKKGEGEVPFLRLAFTLNDEGALAEVLLL